MRWRYESCVSSRRIQAEPGRRLSPTGSSFRSGIPSYSASLSIDRQPTSCNMCTVCDIAGFVDLWDSGQSRAAEDRSSILDRMCRTMRHRGPDDQGMQVSAGVALGMRRLAIIDLVTGHQPISGEDGSVTVVFNGEIYNFHE